MENRRLGEDITAGFGNYLTQKEQQYSRELSEVRSHLEERVKEVKQTLRKILERSKWISRLTLRILRMISRA